MLPTTPEGYAIPEDSRQEVTEFVQAKLGLESLYVVQSGEELGGLLSTDGFQARSYQLDALGRLWDARRRGQHRRLLHMATGLGKTMVAGVDMLKFQDEYTSQWPSLTPRMLYVSHKSDINDQAADSLGRLGPDLNIAMFERRHRYLPNADVTFSTFQLLYSRLDQIKPQSFDYIVWDEGHHTQADTYMEVVEHFDPIDEMAITATPNRADGRDIRDYFGEPVYSKGLADAMAEGWLSSVNYKIVLEQSIKDQLTRSTSIRNLKEARKLFASTTLSPESLAQDIRQEIAEAGLDNPKTIIFAQTIDEAEEIAVAVGGAAYHSRTTNRREVLEDFRSGRLQTIVTRDMFNEGVDIPDAELIVFARSTESEPLFEQQLGRGLRRAPNKSMVYVLDYAGTIERIAMVRSLSKAVRQSALRYTREEQDSINEGEKRSGELRVHSGLDNFVVDKIVADLLARLRMLTPDEYRGRAQAIMEENDAQIISLGQFCRAEGVRQDQVMRLARRNRINMQRLPDSTSVGLDLETQEQMRSLLGYR